MTVDPIYYGEATLVITCLVAVLISAIALVAYIRTRSWKTLFLSASFFILAVPQLFAFAQILGKTPYYSGLAVIDYSFYLSTFSTVIAFALLTYVYRDEKRAGSIMVGGWPRAVGYVLILAVWAVSSYMFIDTELSPAPLALTPYWFFSLARLVAMAVSATLLIVIVLSLYAYSKAERTKSTLIAMVGFGFILVAQIGMSLSYDPTLWRNVAISNGGWMYWAIESLYLLGYLSFLAALALLRISHDRR
jgi:hypothetical protein